MKKTFIISIFIASFVQISAQTNTNYSFKLQGIYGNILPHDTHVKALIKDPVMGGEFSIEQQTLGNKAWQQFQGFPLIGLGAVWLNLGNSEKLGNAFALYPYISYHLIHTKFFSLNLKGGAGVSYLTKTYYNTNTDLSSHVLPSLTGTNGAIGSHVNVYFSGGGSLEIPFSKSLSLTADYTWNHMSNGSSVAPNSGLNMLNGFLGLKYTPNSKKMETPTKKELVGIPRKIIVEIIASGGFRQLYYKDNYLNGIPSSSPNFKTYPIGSIVVAAYHPIRNFMRTGLGIDAFYDGVYDGTTHFGRTYLNTDELKNKIRVGISWQNELLLGKLTAGIHIGMYLYNPLKNLEPVRSGTGELAHPNQNKGLIYPYNIDIKDGENGEDGWLYTRASLKYAISKHYFISLGLKTHLQKAEFIEWGMGYRF